MPALSLLHAAANATVAFAADDEGSSSSSDDTWKIVSTVIGWIYFFSWSISFYPQVYINWQRKSVTGLSFDYMAYNIVGFSCLAVFCGTFYWSPYIQQAYKDRHDGNPNLVQANDVFFGIHAFVMTAVTLTQIYIYGGNGNQKISLFAIIYTSLSVIASVLYAIVGLARQGGADFWLDYVYFLSYIKLSLTFIKYCPQVYLNWLRKSTVGWSIVNVLLDLSGGSLSMVQLILDASISNDWSGVSGDPVKFGLSILTIFFDGVFIVQHYILYPDRSDRDAIVAIATANTSDEKKNGSAYVVVVGDEKKVIKSSSDSDPSSPLLSETKHTYYGGGDGVNHTVTPSSYQSLTSRKTSETLSTSDYSNGTTESEEVDDVVESRDGFNSKSTDTATGLLDEEQQTNRRLHEVSSPSSPSALPAHLRSRSHALWLWHRLTCQQRDCERCRGEPQLN